MKELIIGTVLFITVISAAFYRFGILFSPYIQVDQGVWWPYLGYGHTDITIWKNCSIIYFDRYNWTKQNHALRDTIHLNLAKQYKP